MLRHGVTLSLAAYRLVQRGVRPVGRACRVVGASQGAMGTAVRACISGSTFASRPWQEGRVQGMSTLGSLESAAEQ